VTAGLDAPYEVARWRVIGNVLMAIPHIVILYVLNIAAQVLVFISWFAILITGRMPEGLGTFIDGVHRYQYRIGTFILFLREPYPAFGIPSGYEEPGGDPAWLQIATPGEYSRLMVFFRIIVAIPLFIVGVVYSILLYVCAVVGWFAVLITGRWPAGLRRIVVGVLFWGARFNAWYALLADPYPPFGLS